MQCFNVAMNLCNVAMKRCNVARTSSDEELSWGIVATFTLVATGPACKERREGREGQGVRGFFTSNKISLHCNGAGQYMSSDRGTSSLSRATSKSSPVTWRR